MTSRDHIDIRNLYYFHRFTLASIARLYAVSHTRIQQILENTTTTSVPDINCLICGLEEFISPYHIDKNADNNNPQNVLMLCESHTRKFSHLKRRFKHLV